MVAKKIMGNERAVNNVSILPIPSVINEKRLPRLGNQAVSKARFTSGRKKIPVIATMHVMTDDKSANVLTLFVSFRKKETNPVTKGTNMSKTGTIFFL